MRDVVVDASYCGAWILEDEVSAGAVALLEQALAKTCGLNVPALWHYEMTNLLRSAARRQRLSSDDAWEALQTLAEVPLLQEDLPDAAVRKRILHLALQFELSAYDAAYLELADRLKIPLHTADARLAAAASSLGLAPKA